MRMRIEASPLQEVPMAKREFTKPTDAELAILRVLWDRGPSTVREVTDALQDERGTGYTTALKLLQIMTEKGLVRRDDSARSHVFQASVPAETTQRQMVGDLLDKVFGGSARQLVMQALATKRASREELAEIRRLLDQIEKRGGK
jgi:predicted transcriptional regulator